MEDHFLIVFYVLWLYDRKMDNPNNPHQGLALMIPYEQRFLSCMAFIVDKVVRMTCLLQQTCHANYFVNTVNAKSHAREKPLLTGYPAEGY